MRRYFFYRRDLLGGLARAAWEMARELMVAAVGDKTLRPGVLAVVQTATDAGYWPKKVLISAITLSCDVGSSSK